LIVKANGQKEALTKIITFQHGNKYVPRVLVVVIQALKKNPINYVVWFSQKLQNKTITV
jgi:hypothetical protein